MTDDHGWRARPGQTRMRCWMWGAAASAAMVATASGCVTPPAELTEEEALIAQGRDIFFNETFDGNGRTCVTCHREEDNFGLTPAFMATLPDDDPLFVAEFDPNLETLERPALMREFGLILENLDGFDDLETQFVLRGIPHTLALSTTVDSIDGPRTGWSGDGAPGDGSLRSFATGAVIQHFPKSLNRVEGVDFRLPTDEELDAVEAFMLSLGRQEELTLPLPLKGAVAARGQEVFNDAATGKCFGCHFNAGATVAPGLLPPDPGNRNFDTGVEDLENIPQKLVGAFIPPDDGFDSPGDGEFNIPPVVEAADTAPFFHNNSILTIEGAVEFYNSDAFNNSPAGVLIAERTGSGINLPPPDVEAVAAFLRVINALENMRVSTERLEAAQSLTSFWGSNDPTENLRLAVEEIDDAIMVLSGAGLHPEAVVLLRDARGAAARAAGSASGRSGLITEALAAQESARDELVDRT